MNRAVASGLERAWTAAPERMRAGPVSEAFLGSNCNPEIGGLKIRLVGGLDEAGRGRFISAPREVAFSARLWSLVCR